MINITIESVFPKNMELTFDSLESLPCEINESEISKTLNARPLKALKRIRALLVKYPNHPWLGVMQARAYVELGNEETGDALLIENYKLNPKHFLTRLYYAQYCISKEHFSEIPNIFENHYTLAEMYPNQTEFEFSDFVIFCRVMCFYFAHTEDFKNALPYFDTIMALLHDGHEPMLNLRDEIAHEFVVLAGTHYADQLRRQTYAFLKKSDFNELRA